MEMRRRPPSASTRPHFAQLHACCDWNSRFDSFYYGAKVRSVVPNPIDAKDGHKLSTASTSKILASAPLINSRYFGHDSIDWRDERASCRCEDICRRVIMVVTRVGALAALASLYGKQVRGSCRGWRKRKNGEEERKER